MLTIDEVEAAPDRDAMRLRSRARARPPVIRVREERVKALMQACKWTPSELARRMGVDQSGVIRLLTGEQNAGGPSIGGLIAAFRDVFGEHVGFDQLFEVIEFEVAEEGDARRRTG